MNRRPVFCGSPINGLGGLFDIAASLQKTQTLQGQAPDDQGKTGQT